MSGALKHGDIPSWAYAATKALLESLKAVDPDTYHHCLRVGASARLLARDAGLDEYQQIAAEFAGILHDIGKMTLKQEILNKPARLTDEEMEHVKSHSIASERLVAPLAHHDFFQYVVPVIRSHHERVDGQGYPDKLGGETIPLLSRVILVVDTVDAMTQNRVYRKGLPMDVVLAELKKYSGTQFDAQLVNVFFDSHRFWKPEHSEMMAEIHDSSKKKTAA